MAKKGNFDAFKKKDDNKKEKKKGVSRGPKRPANAKVIRTGEKAEPVRLNRFIAQSGLCSRRDADAFITDGKVKVNGKVTTELGTKVLPGKDKVEFNGKRLEPQTFAYFVMNKPKNHITTMKDDRERKTVMDIIKIYTNERVYPVGRLDRNTTGLLIFTNDGKLAEKLTHPSHRIRKVYHIKVDRPLEAEHVDALRAGIMLEDGPIKVDRIDPVDGGGLDEAGIEIHSGRNRIVRRMFEHFNYNVLKLDRVSIGPLTKKNLPRGKCRPLTEKEISFLKMM